jgi:hypothetical protein
MHGPLNAKSETTHLHTTNIASENMLLYSVIGPLFTGCNACILHPPPDEDPPGQNTHDDNCTYVCSQHPQHAV